MLRSPSAAESENEKGKTKGSNAKVSDYNPPPDVANDKPSPQTLFTDLGSPPPPLPSIFLPMAGGSSLGARRAFASSLLEPFYGPEAEAMKQKGIKTLDEGVVGYSIDLAPLRGQSAAPGRLNVSPSNGVTDIVEGGGVGAESPIPLIQTSLNPLTPSKPRLVNSTDGPHEILRYITQVGVDVFDAAWAQRLAGWGVGLDFQFPMREGPKEEGKRLIGHNLYAETYAFDFGTIADNFRGGVPATEEDNRPICTCAACSPLTPLDQDQLRHGVDSPEHSEESAPTIRKHHTRAYIHHLLQTHEMSAHTLLAMHNLTVLDRFFEGIRGVLGSLAPALSPESATVPSETEIEDGGMQKWMEEVDRFCRIYDEAKSGELFECARGDWRDVDRARGKGRLAREREKEMREEKIQN